MSLQLQMLFIFGLQSSEDLYNPIVFPDYLIQSFFKSVGCIFHSDQRGLENFMYNVWFNLLSEFLLFSWPKNDQTAFTSLNHFRVVSVCEWYMLLLTAPYVVSEAGPYNENSV